MLISNGLPGINMRMLATLIFPLISPLLTSQLNLTVKVNKVPSYIYFRKPEKDTVFVQDIFSLLQKDGHLKNQKLFWSFTTL